MNTSEIKAAKKLKLIKNTNQNIKYLINRKLYIYIYIFKNTTIINDAKKLK